MKEIELQVKIRRIIRSNIRLVNYTKFGKPAVKIRGYDKAAKALEKYVLKARIRQLEYVKQQELQGGYCIDEDIAELQKGLE